MRIKESHDIKLTDVVHRAGAELWEEDFNAEQFEILNRWKKINYFVHFCN